MARTSIERHSRLLIKHAGVFLIAAVIALTVGLWITQVPAAYIFCTVLIGLLYSTVVIFHWKHDSWLSLIIRVIGLFLCIYWAFFIERLTNPGASAPLPPSMALVYFSIISTVFFGLLLIGRPRIKRYLHSEESNRINTEVRVSVNANEEKKAAAAVADEWLRLIDAGDAAESWNQTSSLFKNGVQSPSLFRAGVSAQQWQSSLAAMRSQPGRAVSRTLQSKRYAQELLGEPDREYVILEYAAAFERKNVMEIVVLVKESDGKWRVSDYRIRLGLHQTASMK